MVQSYLYYYNNITTIYSVFTIASIENTDRLSKNIKYRTKGR